MYLAADTALPIVAIRDIVMLTHSILQLFVADLALLIVVLMILVADPHVLRLMPGRGGFFFLLRIADLTLGGFHARFGAGCGVGQLCPLVRGLFRKAAILALRGMRICTLVRGIFQLMCARYTNRLAAVLADLYARSAALILIFLMLMRAALDHAAAVADVLRCAVLRGDRLIAVMNGPAAVETGDAVAHGIAVAAFARTDIPTVGQRVAKRQRIAVLQIIARHGRTGIIRRAADGIHPAGTHCVVKFTDAGACAGQRDTVAVDAAPEDRFVAVRAEAAVDPGKDLIRRAAELVPTPAERICPAAEAGAVVHRLQIKAGIQCIFVGAAAGRPVEAVCSRAERVARVIVPDGLGDHIGDRLLGQHIIADGPADAETQDAHVDIDAGRADLLALFGAFADKFQGQFAIVALFVLGVDIQRMLVPVALVQILRDEQILLHIAGGAFKLHVFAVQLNGQLCLRTGGKNVADAVARSVLCPGFNSQVDLLPVGDGSTVAQVRFDLHLVFASVLVGNVEYKRIAVAA